MGDNVTAAQGAEGTGTAAGPPFVTEKWAGAPGGAAHVGYGKLVFGVHGAFTIVDDVDGNRFPVKPIGPRGSMVDASVAIATGGLSQVLLTANPARLIVWIWNPPSETEYLFVNFGASAAADLHSVPIPPGGMLKMASPEFVDTDQVTVFALTTGHKVGCKYG
jgi:hypothetical protein